MRVGSSSDSIYQLMMPKTKPSDPAETASQATTPSGRSFGGAISDSAAASALQAKLAESSFNRNDTDHNGYVDRNEFIENNMKPRADGYQPDLEDVVDQWNKLDANGKGSLNEQEYTDGFKSVFQVSVGHFSKPLR